MRAEIHFKSNSQLVRDSLTAIVEDGVFQTDKPILVIKEELNTILDKLINEGVDVTSNSLTTTWINQQKDGELTEKEVENNERARSLAILSFDRLGLMVSRKEYTGVELFFQDRNPNNEPFEVLLSTYAEEIIEDLTDYIKPNLERGALVNTGEIVRNYFLIQRIIPLLDEEVVEDLLRVWRRGDDVFSYDMTSVDLVEIMMLGYKFASKDVGVELNDYVVTRRIDRDAKRIIREARRLSLTFYYENIFKSSIPGYQREAMETDYQDSDNSEY